MLPGPAFPTTPAGAAQLKVVESHQALFVADCSPARLSEIVGRELQRLVGREGASSAMVVPLISRGIVLGVLTLVAARRLRKFSPSDLTTAEDLAERIAVRLDNARLYQKAREAVAAREELLALVAHDLRNPLSAIRLSAMSITSVPPARRTPEGVAPDRAGAADRGSHEPDARTISPSSAASTRDRSRSTWRPGRSLSC